MLNEFTVFPKYTSKTFLHSRSSLKWILHKTTITNLCLPNCPIVVNCFHYVFQSLFILVSFYFHCFLRSSIFVAFRKTRSIKYWHVPIFSWDYKIAALLLQYRRLQQNLENCEFPPPPFMPNIIKARLFQFFFWQLSLSPDLMYTFIKD